jgi:lysozyme
MVNKTRMAEQLIMHEGLRLKPYRCTEGYLTVLVGFNIDARGWAELSRILGRKVDASSTFTKDDAMTVLNTDIDRFEKAVIVHFPEYKKLDEVRQRVVLDMAFNLGFRALSFKDTIAAIKMRNWSKAVRCMFRSKWANQVDDGEGKKFGRADRLAQMMLTGVDYTS